MQINTASKKIFRLVQPTDLVHLALRTSYDFAEKQGLILVRGFFRDGAETKPTSGASWSESIGANFVYIPSGPREKWFEFAKISFSSPVSSVRIDYLNWSKNAKKSILWDQLEVRLVQPLVQNPFASEKATIGSFDVMPEEVK